MLPGYYINVGLFADENNALKVHTKLQAAGLPVVIQNVRLRDQTLLRVRVGPFANRVQAQATLAKIHVLKLDATLVKP
jgi:cell division septation protein DedD